MLNDIADAMRRYHTEHGYPPARIVVGPELEMELLREMNAGICVGRPADRLLPARFNGAEIDIDLDAVGFRLEGDGRAADLAREAREIAAGFKADLRQWLLAHGFDVTSPQGREATERHEQSIDAGTAQLLADLRRHGRGISTMAPGTLVAHPMTGLDR